MTGRVIAGRYNLAEPLGRGAMGVVWRARDLLLDRDVAVKEVVLNEAIGEDERQNAYQRTLREARTAARLSHRGVVTVFDVAEEDGRPWIVMELVPSRSLDQILAEDGALAPRRAARVGQQLLSALAAAHAAGVLHRDVKPSNVLIAPDGIDAERAVLTDFGIAQFQGDPRLTQTGMVMGSPGFTAPERIRGGSATPASDLWSLGATLYAAVEGRGPYEQRGGAITTMTAIINEDAPEAWSAGRLRPLIAALLRREPSGRPPAAIAARMFAEVIPLLPEDRPRRPQRTPTVRSASLPADPLAAPRVAFRGSAPEKPASAKAAVAEETAPSENAIVPQGSAQDRAPDEAAAEKGVAASSTAADESPEQKEPAAENVAAETPAAEDAAAEAAEGTEADESVASAESAESADAAEADAAEADENAGGGEEAASKPPVGEETVPSVAASAVSGTPDEPPTTVDEPAAGDEPVEGKPVESRSAESKLADSSAPPAQSEQGEPPSGKAAEMSHDEQGVALAQPPSWTPTHWRETGRAGESARSVRENGGVPPQGGPTFSAPRRMGPPTRPQPPFSPPAYGPPAEGYRVSAPRPARKRRGLAFALAGVVVLAAVAIVVVLLTVHSPTSQANQTTGTGNSTTSSNNAPSSVKAIDSPASLAPSGWLTATIPPEKIGTAAGFSIAVPPTWKVQPGNLATNLLAPDGVRYMEIDLTPHKYTNMVSEAKYIAKQATAEGHLPKYHQLSIEPVTIRGTQGAFWDFTWVTASDTTMRVDDLLFILDGQSYAIYFTSPSAEFSTANGLALFDKMLHTFQPVT